MGLKAIVSFPSSGGGSSSEPLLGANTWDSGTTYEKNDFVKIGSSGTVLYIALRENFDKPPASSPSDWSTTTASAQITDILNQFP